jgi:hypothetical protein
MRRHGAFRNGIVRKRKIYDLTLRTILLNEIHRQPASSLDDPLHF